MFHEEDTRCSRQQKWIVWFLHSTYTQVDLQAKYDAGRKSRQSWGILIVSIHPTSSPNDLMYVLFPLSFRIKYPARGEAKIQIRSSEDTSTNCVCIKAHVNLCKQNVYQEVFVMQTWCNTFNFFKLWSSFSTLTVTTLLNGKTSPSVQYRNSKSEIIRPQWSCQVAEAEFPSGKKKKKTRCTWM